VETATLQKWLDLNDDDDDDDDDGLSVLSGLIKAALYATWQSLGSSSARLARRQKYS